LKHKGAGRAIAQRASVRLLRCAFTLARAIACANAQARERAARKQAWCATRGARTLHPDCARRAHACSAAARAGAEGGRAPSNRDIVGRPLPPFATDRFARCAWLVSGAHLARGSAPPRPPFPVRWWCRVRSSRAPRILAPPLHSCTTEGTQRPLKHGCPFSVDLGKRRPCPPRLRRLPLGWPALALHTLSAKSVPIGPAKLWRNN
jgi:hypothetical protein